ncbi:ABC transporter ATP-binding protein [Nocardioides dongxiaopingii]|uniref:ABC transporter ATP-binding protein n=1 Tax=Nocardioides sp. S-1144 TaxID=2582905 RepID=UPI0026D70FD1|nr:ABC transporter ATP-binding protein [Nocardioides sp. S-1144]
MSTTDTDTAGEPTGGTTGGSTGDTGGPAGAARGASASGTSMTTGEELGAIETIRRGIRHSPELTHGIRGTLALAVLASVGQVVVPIAVQQTLDRGLNGPDGPDLSYTVLMGVLAGLAVVVTSVASYLMTTRLFTVAEHGLATLRVKAFRHVHDLPLLTQNTERRGALVSRVTSDVDQVSQFLVFGGLLFVISIGQVLIATLVMLFYSWQLALVVWVCFAPLFLSLRYFQRKLSDAYSLVRRQVGSMLSAISEPVVGAAVVKSYAVEARTQARIDEAVAIHQRASTRAQGFTAVSFSLGGLSAGLANAGVLVVGIWLGQGRFWSAGNITAGEVLAFAFLVTLFVGPVQMGTQILTDAQNAIAGWRRVIGILDTPADLVDPGEDGHVLPRGPIDVHFADVGFAYPGGPPVLRDVTLDIDAGRRVAIVGETGSGKSTFAKLLTRLMDPSSGAVLLDGIDVRDVGQASLRSSVVLVPQEGFLFDDTITANVRYGKLDATEDDVRASAEELGLGDWLAGLPAGLDTRVGQRGESLSAGERQLVALLRAHLADPDLLVLDEATSAVDPQLEMRIGRALERLMSGRTSVTIAHRLSTAENADEVVVVDRGRVVQRGPHAVLVAEPGSVYAGLHRSWVAQQS